MQHKTFCNPLSGIKLPLKKYSSNEDYLLTPTSKEFQTLELRPDAKRIKWGERKLTLAIIQFLSRFWSTKTHSAIYIIYIASAPLTNIPFITKLFPNSRWTIYAKVKPRIKPNDRIWFTTELFTDNDTKFWTGRNDVFFISDHRTHLDLSADQDIINKSLTKDLEDQMRWHLLIKPVRSLLKFRLPYPKEGIYPPPMYEYLNGWTFKQAFSSNLSPELRLVPFGEDKTKYDLLKHRRQISYFNLIIRTKQKYKSPWNDKGSHVLEQSFPKGNDIDPPELFNDWDSYTEAYIWLDYLNRFPDKNTKQWVIAMSRGLTKELTKNKPFKSIDALRESNKKRRK